MLKSFRLWTKQHAWLWQRGNWERNRKMTNGGCWSGSQVYSCTAGKDKARKDDLWWWKQMIEHWEKEMMRGWERPKSLLDHPENILMENSSLPPAEGSERGDGEGVNPNHSDHGASQVFFNKILFSCAKKIIKEFKSVHFKNAWQHYTCFASFVKCYDKWLQLTDTCVSWLKKKGVFRLYEFECMCHLQKHFKEDIWRCRC